MLCVHTSMRAERTYSHVGRMAQPPTHWIGCARPEVPWPPIPAKCLSRLAHHACRSLWRMCSFNVDPSILRQPPQRLFSPDRFVRLSGGGRTRIVKPVLVSLRCHPRRRGAPKVRTSGMLVWRLYYACTMHVLRCMQIATLTPTSILWESFMVGRRSSPVSVYHSPYSRQAKPTAPDAVSASRKGRFG